MHGGTTADPEAGGVANGFQVDFCKYIARHLTEKYARAGGEARLSILIELLNFQRHSDEMAYELTTPLGEAWGW